MELLILIVIGVAALCWLVDRSNKATQRRRDSYSRWVREDTSKRWPGDPY